jgi:hypothetical protein
MLAGINFLTNGGDEHISIDRLKEGKFVAKDLRLRFEFGNVSKPNDLVIPPSAFEPFSIQLDSLKFNFLLCQAQFDKLKGHWEKGGDGKSSWIDFVFYSGEEKVFDLTKINKAVMGFTFSKYPSGQKQPVNKVKMSEKDEIMNLNWEELNLEIPVKPQTPKSPFI